MGIFGNGPQRQQFQAADEGGGDYDGGTPDARTTRTPYRGPRVRSRSTGQVYYWVGSEYVPENDLRRLTPQERQARQDAVDYAAQQQRVLPDLHRFEQLNRTVPTGSLTQRLGQFFAGDNGPAPRMVGIDNPHTPQNEPAGYDEMTSITDRLAPRQRQPGSGSSSNLDVSMFRGALPNMGRDGPANSNIIRSLEREAADSQAYAEFLDWYWPRNGSLAGAQEQFQQFRSARERNPRLTWRQFFDRQQPQQQRPQQGGQGQTLRYNPATGEFH